MVIIHISYVPCHYRRKRSLGCSKSNHIPRIRSKISRRCSRGGRPFPRPPTSIASSGMISWHFLYTSKLHARQELNAAIPKSTLPWQCGRVVSFGALHFMLNVTDALKTCYYFIMNNITITRFYLSTSQKN